jgi:hypothetical protein
MTVDEAKQRVRAVSMSGDKRVLLNGVVSAGRVLADKVERLQEIVDAAIAFWLEPTTENSERWEKIMNEWCKAAEAAEEER